MASRFITGTSASDVHFQVYLLEGLTWWNQTRALAAAQQQSEMWVFNLQLASKAIVYCCAWTLEVLVLLALYATNQTKLVRYLFLTWKSIILIMRSKHGTRKRKEERKFCSNARVGAVFCTTLCLRESSSSKWPAFSFPLPFQHHSTNSMIQKITLGSGLLLLLPLQRVLVCYTIGKNFRSSF